MKIAIFWATGKVGRHLLDQALERGDEVAILVRDPSKLTTQGHERLKVVRGDVLDPRDVDQAVVGTDAVLSALGHTKTSARHSRKSARPLRVVTPAPTAENSYSLLWRSWC